MIERTDIDARRTWIISDTHFGHKNIVRFCDRPENHNEIMMENWAETVLDTDTILHLGDVTYRDRDFFADYIAPNLTGARKLLILGNHDGQKPSYYEKAGFEIIEPFWLRWQGLQGHARISFSHYPWEQHEGPLIGYHIHGHIHNNGYSMERFVPYMPNQINVSVEMMHYRPVNLEFLLQGAVYGATREDLA